MSQDWSLTPSQAAPPAPKGKGAIVTGAVMLVLGILMVVGGIIGLVASAASLVSGFSAPVTTPTTFSRTLDGGTTYVVYELTLSGSGSSSDPVVVNVLPGDVTVTGPGGISVPVTDPGSVTQTYTSGSDSFAGVAQFDAPTTGVYEVAIATEGSEVVLAPSFGTLAKSLVWIALIGLGGLLALIGIILLIVGLIRRSSSKRAAAPAYPAGGYVTPQAQGYAAPAQGYVTPVAQAPVAQEPVAPVEPVQPAAPAPAPVAATPPAGWYPDPSRPGGQRYWDGNGWTEHQA